VHKGLHKGHKGSHRFPFSTR